MKVKYNASDKLLIMQITEEIDHHISEKIRDRADFEIQKYMPKKVILDFENVSFMDSSGIGMIIGRYKTATTFGSTINMINVKPNIKKVFEMAGILKLIPIIEEMGGNEIEKCIWKWNEIRVYE